MESVFRLVDDDRLRTVDDVVRDFEAPMRGQAMHDHGVRLRAVEELRVHLIRAKQFFAFLLLPLLSHRDPDVGVDDVGLAGSGRRVRHDVDGGTARLRETTGLFEHIRIGLVAGRTSGGHVHPDDRVTEEERAAALSKTIEKHRTRIGPNDSHASEQFLIRPANMRGPTRTSRTSLIDSKTIVTAIAMSPSGAAY